MDKFNDLRDLALKVREEFEDFESQKYGRSWDLKDLIMGLQVDVGDLVRLVQEKDGIRPERSEELQDKIAHELSDILWVVFVLSSKLHVDMQKSFVENMAELQEFLKRG
jgi:NTP pyrophosphatase (non-canonical NTP hydrolase)